MCLVFEPLETEVLLMSSYSLSRECEFTTEFRIPFTVTSISLQNKCLKHYESIKIYINTKSKVQDAFQINKCIDYLLPLTIIPSLIIQ
jgi:hypothetical protein